MENERLSERELLLKADGVRDCVKWLEAKIKEKKQSRDIYYNSDIATMVVK